MSMQKRLPRLPTLSPLSVYYMAQLPWPLRGGWACHALRAFALLSFCQLKQGSLTRQSPLSVSVTCVHLGKVFPNHPGILYSPSWLCFSLRHLWPLARLLSLCICLHLLKLLRPPAGLFTVGPPAPRTRACHVVRPPCVFVEWMQINRIMSRNFK